VAIDLTQPGGSSSKEVTVGLDKRDDEEEAHKERGTIEGGEEIEEEEASLVFGWRRGGR
jgi:hypothetical protein